MDQIAVQPNLVPVEFDYNEVPIFTFYDRWLLLKNRQQSKQKGKEEYFHLRTDYTRSGQKGKVNVDDSSPAKAQRKNQAQRTKKSNRCFVFPQLSAVALAPTLWARCAG